jgi:hypothetical protein
VGVWVGVKSFRQLVRFPTGSVYEESKDDEKIELGHGDCWCLEVVVGRWLVLVVGKGTYLIFLLKFGTCAVGTSFCSVWIF